MSVVLTKVVGTNADLSSDLRLGLDAFCAAYEESSEADLVAHFGGFEEVRKYYASLFQREDVEPFLAGKALWVRALRDGNLVGWMTVYPNFREPNSVYVSTLAVDPGHRLQDVGQILMNSIGNEWFPEVSSIYLISRTINRKATRFFEQLGYRKISGIQSELLDNSDHCFFMKREL